MADERSRFKDLKSARSKIPSLKNQHNKGLKNRLETVTEASEQTQTLQKNYKTLEEKHRKMSQKCKKAEKKHKGLQRKIDGLQRQITERKEEERKLSEKLEAALKKHQELKRKNKELTDQVTKMKSERQKELECYKKIEAENKAKDNALEENDKKLKLKIDSIRKKVETLTELPGCKYESSV